MPPTLSWGRETKGVFSFAKERPSLSAQARREMQRTAPFAFFSKERGTLPPTCRWGRETKGVFSFAKERPSLSAQARREMQRAAPCFLFQRKRNFAPTLSWGRETKGVFSFAKENTPFGTPRERPDRQPRSRRSAAPPEWKCLRGGLAPLAAIGSAIRFDLLLLPAAALPILQRCSLIPVYR